MIKDLSGRRRDLETAVGGTIGPRALRLFTALAVSLGVVGPASADVYRKFSEWAVSCSEGLTCSATVDAGGEPIYALGLRRSKAAEAPLVLMINPQAATALDGPVRFAFEGGATVEIPAEMFAQDGNGALTSEDPMIAEGLLGALQSAPAVTVTVPQDGGRSEQRFSLAGLTASLLFIDETQRRAGTVTALAARGDAPAADVSALPNDVETAGDLPPAVREAWAASPTGCAEFAGFEPQPLGFSAEVPDARLFGLACGSPGAYNFYYEFFLDAGGTVYSVPFPELSDEGPIAARGTWNVAWDDPSKTVSSFFKGRGLGDCGLFQRWRWSENASASGGLVLEEARAKEDCDGDHAGGPMEWPRIWPAG